MRAAIVDGGHLAARAHLLLFVSLQACATGAVPRRAEVAAPGAVNAEVTFPVTTLAPGVARGQTTARPTDGEPAPASPVEIDGNSGGLISGHPLLFIFPTWIQVDVRVGVFEPCEAGVTLSWLRQGGEVRCGIARQDGGAPLSAALSLAAAWQPWIVEPGGFYRAGVDLERRIGGVHLLLGGALTYGSMSHAITDVPESLDDGTDRHAGPWVKAVRDELRLSVPVGVAIDADGGNGLTVGVVPHVNLAAGDAKLECNQCGSADLRTFSERWGVTLTVGGHFASDGPVFGGPASSAPVDRTAFVVGGLSAVITGYFLGLMPTAIIAGGDERAEFPLRLLVPVVGAFLWAADEPDPAYGGMQPAVGYLSGGIQAVGAGLLLYAWLAPDPPTVAVLPAAGGDVAGLQAFGRF